MDVWPTAYRLTKLEIDPAESEVSLAVIIFVSTVILPPETLDPSVKTPLPNLEIWSCSIVCDCVNSLA